MSGRGYHGAYLDPYGIFEGGYGRSHSFDFDDDNFRAGFASVSKRATQACENLHFFFQIPSVLTLPSSLLG